VTRHALSFALLLGLGGAPRLVWADVADGHATAASEQPRATRPLATAPEPSWTIPTLHTTGLFLTLRFTEAYLYPNPFAETRLSVIGGHYQQAFTRPPLFDASKPAFEWDGDRWQINVVGHALLGSEMYLRARTCGHGVLASLAFTAGGTVAWEYAFEGNGVRPSALDLLYTPASGLALGEFRYWLWSESGTVTPPVWRRVVSAVFDPFGEAERWAGTPC
jgi:hypothetical protein